MKEKKPKRSIFDPSYRPYGRNTGPKGSPDAWRAAFQERFSEAQIKEIIGDESPWGILGLTPGASPVEIKRAFRRLSFETHPDTTKNPAFKDGAEFRRVKAAYEKLTPA